MKSKLNKPKYAICVSKFHSSMQFHIPDDKELNIFMAQLSINTTSLDLTKSF